MIEEENGRVQGFAIQERLWLVQYLGHGFPFVFAFRDFFRSWKGRLGFCLQLGDRVWLVKEWLGPTLFLVHDFPERDLVFGAYLCNSAKVVWLVNLEVELVFYSIFVGGGLWNHPKRSSKILTIGWSLRNNWIAFLYRS